MKLPSGWKLVKLVNIAAKQPNAIVDGPFGSNLKLSDYVADGVPVLQGKNITGNKFQWFDVRFISEKKAHSLRRSLVKEGDILIVKIGSIGYSAQIDSLRGYPHALIPANLCKVTPDLSIVDPSYLVYYLNSKNSVEYLQSNASATSQPALSLSKVKELPIPLPPLDEQKRIASLLARADRLRGLRRAARALGESLLQGVFLEMFGEEEGKTKKVLLGEISQIASGVTKGQNYKGRKTVEVPYLRVANVQDGYLDLSEIKTIQALPSEVEELRLQVGDVVMTEGGDFDKLGRGAIWRGQIENCIHQNHIFRVRLDNSKVLPEFFENYLLSSEAKRYFLTASKQTTNLASINMTQLKQLPVPLYPLSLQEEFARVVARVEGLRGRMSESERQVDGLFGSLLSQSFGG